MRKHLTFIASAALALAVMLLSSVTATASPPGAMALDQIAGIMPADLFLGVVAQPADSEPCEAASPGDDLYIVARGFKLPGMKPARGFSPVLADLVALNATGVHRKQMQRAPPAAR